MTKSLYEEKGYLPGMVCPECNAVTQPNGTASHALNCKFSDVTTFLTERCLNCYTPKPNHQIWCKRPAAYPCRHCGCDMGVENPVHRDTCPDATLATPLATAEVYVGVPCPICGCDKISGGVSLHWGGCLAINTEVQVSSNGEKFRITDSTPTLTINLLPGTEEYAADVKAFVDLMVWKLYKNIKKGHWRDVDLDKALKLLHGEVKELVEAIPSTNIAWIMEESADTANMALIIASTAMRKAAVK